MRDGGQVVVDADELLERINKVRGSFDELSSFLAKCMTTKPLIPASREKDEKDAMELDIDISGIEWLTKDRQPAGPNAPWCWAFSTTQDGGIRRETLQLVQALEQYGKVRIGKYELSLGGRDGNLLNRKTI